MSEHKKTKSQLSALVAEGRLRESFTHYQDGKETHYDVTAMRAEALLGQYELAVADISLVLPHLLENHDYDMDRVMELDDQSWRSDPCIAVLEGEGEEATTLFVDGTHRIIRRDKEGLKDFYFYLVLPKQIIFVDQRLWTQKPGFDWGHDIVNGQIQYV